MLVAHHPSFESPSDGSGGGFLSWPYFNSFIDVIVRLQRKRQIRASHQPDDVQFHDRCVVCTAALATYLGHPFSPVLANELARITEEAVYEHPVFFIRNLGFVTPTDARRISFEETVRFEKVHEETYRNFGFELVSIEPGSLAERVSVIKAATRSFLRKVHSVETPW